LQRECPRNVAVMWRIGQLTPDFQTIADFRRDNGKAIRKVCTRFIALWPTQCPPAQRRALHHPATEV
jgi:hypothetical protein